MIKTFKIFLLTLVFTILSGVAFGDDAAVTASATSKRDTLVVKMASDPVLIAAVKAYNTAKPAELKDMAQDAWDKLPLMDDKIKLLMNNDAGKKLKTSKDDSMVEVFLNGIDGCKVALLSKTSGWCHKGKPKHDAPMKGDKWLGNIEEDESAGTKTIQVSVPVKDGNNVIGSLVVGFDVTKLK